MPKKYESMYLDEYILLRLAEVQDERRIDPESEFLLGEVYAYIECLEVILKNGGAEDEELLNLEERFGIR